MSEYEHTQRSPLDELLWLVAAALTAGAWFAAHETAAMLPLIALAAVFAVLAPCFAHLTVRDEDDRLVIRYGPLPLFHTHIPYSTITRVEPDRSTILDGWGIHYVPFRGWTYNLWGMDCVRIEQNGQVTRVGSDDVQNLTAFLQSKVQSMARQSTAAR